MKQLLLIIAILFATNIFGQVDSTLYKKYSADRKTLQEAAQRLEKEKFEFLGKYYESITAIQQQFQVVELYFREQEKLVKKDEKKK